MAGAVVNGRCLEDAIAPDVYFSTVPPSLNNGVLSTFSNDGLGSWYFVQIDQYSSAVLSSSPALLPSFVPCDTVESYTAGFVLGAAVVMAAVAVYVIGLMRRGL